MLMLMLARVLHTRPWTAVVGYAFRVLRLLTLGTELSCSLMDIWHGR